MSARRISKVEELAEIAELADVVYDDFSVHRGPFAGERPDFPPEPSLVVGVRLQPETYEFKLELKLGLQEPPLRCHVSAVARFDFPEPLEITSEVRDEFASRVALMCVFPFVRAGLASLAARMRTPSLPVLALVRPGDLRPWPDEQEGEGGDADGAGDAV